MSRKVVFNTKERIVSTDSNRLQAFAASDLGEVLHQLFDSKSNDDNAAGNGAVGTSAATPMRAAVLGGLLVRPQLGSADTLVDPGVLAAVNPFAGDTPEDSPYKVVPSEGSLLGGTLVMGANSSGDDRVDVVECRVVPANVDEQDNRDVYDPISGLFTAASVPKVTRDLLQFRIRQGTPGGGMPVRRPGWLPLMVATVPDGATTWDDVDFMWDVRPLVHERVRPFADLTVEKPGMRWKQSAYIEAGGSGGSLHGFLECEGPDGYILGGNVNASLPETFLLSSEWKEPGFAAVAKSAWFLYALAPFGLPRWAPYNAAALGPRLPSAPRGVLVVTHKKPKSDGTPASAVALPTPTGLGGTSANGRCILSGMMNNSADVKRLSMSNNDYRFPETGGGTDASITPFSTVDGPPLVATYKLTVGTHFPAHARRVYLRHDTTLDVVALNDTVAMKREVELLDQNGDPAWSETERFVMYSSLLLSNDVTDQAHFEVFLPQPLANGDDYTLTFTYTTADNVTGFQGGTTKLVIAGWTLT